MTPGTDTVLGARYRLVDRIAGGGMGDVWRADDVVLGRTVAVKILRREYADDPTFLARFKAEARHTAGLSHANVAAVYDFGEGGEGGEQDGSPYLVMEHVPGEPLSTLVAREGALSPERTLAVIGQAALGLQTAHDAGVIHRDVKPGNILVTPDGTVKVTDFGIARAAGAVPLTQTGAIMGTAFYISPEQASGRSVTPASDIYSLGVVGYECLTGRRPFEGDTPVSVALAQVSQEPPALPDDVPEPVRELVMRMLAKDPAARPASAGDLGREALTLRPAVAAAATEEPARTSVLPAVAGPAAAGADTGRDAVETTAVAPRDDPPTDPGFRLPEVARGPTWLPYAAGLLAVALLLLLAVRACAAGEPAANSPAHVTATGPTAPSTVQVVARDYLGRPVRDARSELRGLGLQVSVSSSEGGGVVGTVKHVSPTGTLRAGTTVTLQAVAAPSSPPGESRGREKQDKPGKGHGRTKGD